MQKLSRAQRNSLERRTARYHNDLWGPDGDQALTYLIEERGLTEETIEKFRLGIVVDPLESDGGAKGMISIPYITPSGVVALRFRRPPDKETGPKYWQPPGSEITIFNTRRLTIPSTWITIAEGEFDAMVLEQCNIPAVGIPGASNWQPHYRAVFEGYERVIICGDNDGNGDKSDDPDKEGASEKFAKKIAKQVEGPAFFMFPEGHDVSSYQKEHGPEALRQFLKIDQKGSS